MLEAAWRDAPSEVLRQRLAQALLLEGEVVARGGDAARPHLDRLERAGYVPIEPFPTARG